MYVEPEYREMNVGTLGLEAIKHIHEQQGMDFTVLVADDDGSGKLVKWYQDHGFSTAPALQTMLGSPDGQYGITMITPTGQDQNRLTDCTIQWW